MVSNVLNRIEQPVNADLDDNIYNLGGTVNCDTITELTADAGVTIDGVLLKDGTVTKTGPDMIDVNTGITAFATGGHSATMIPVFAYGPGAEAFKGIYQNTELFHKMIAAARQGE